MRSRRAVLAAVAFLMIAAWAQPAAADVTGTAGEITVVYDPNFQAGTIKFKLTDLNQTKACAQVNGNPVVGAGYAWFFGQTQSLQGQLRDPAFREWYAALLVSKKGSPITCATTPAPECRVTSCTLP